MLWDVFCRVIDNFGDIGVCWRLSADLAARGHAVRLWVDDASALTWMAPHGHAGIEVRGWAEAERTAPLQQPGDVVVEAFGCDPPDAFLAAMQRAKPPAWVNLEYLSAESYVERSHGLRSPVFSGPAAGLTKRFFYPGFTPATGGLLREPGLLARQQRFRATQRLGWLQGVGVPAEAGDALVSVFCYRGAPLAAWLNHFASEASQRSQATRILLTPGHATQLAQQWASQASPALAAALQLHALPSLSQVDFDHLLWSCDLNIVRGEDSAVRALWAGRPHIWHIYPQDDGVHADKLEAFMSRWMSDADWSPELRGAVQAGWRHFNADLPDSGGVPPLPEWRGTEGAWARASEASCTRLARQTDLVTQLIDFVTGSG